MEHKFSITFNAKNALWRASYLGVGKFDPVVNFDLDFKSEDQAKGYCRKFAYMKEKEMTGTIENTFVVSVGKTEQETTSPKETATPETPATPQSPQAAA